MDEFDRDGAHAEIERLAALSQSRKPPYSDRFLSKRTPGTEHLGAPREEDVQLSAADLLAAQRELAELHGVSSARVRGMVMLATVQAGLGYSETEQAAVISEVALSLERGQDAVSGEQILELSGRAGADTIGLEDQRAAVRDEAAVLGLTVTQAERDKYAESGVALPGGDFPVPDARHLAAAKSEYKKRHLAGHSAAEVRAHINRNAKRLGLPGLDDDDHDEGDVAATMALAGVTQETAGMMALAAGQNSAAAVVARHPELSHLFKPRTSNRKHPAKSGRAGMLTTGSRAHSSDLDDDTRDARQPARGGAVHADVKRLIEENPGLFSDGTGHEGEGTGNVTYRPTPYRSPGPSGKPQSGR